MKIAVLSDIHGNYLALERCLEYAVDNNIHTFIFLGDYIGELAYPDRTMKILYDLKENYDCYFIKGNKEDYWLNYKANGEMGWRDGDSTTGILLYAYQALTSKDMEFFASLNLSDVVDIEGMAAITICHGSPEHTNQKMLQDDRTYETIDNIDTILTLCGHTHIQRKITYKNKSVLNPGAVGVPLLSEGKTQFMILHGNEGIWTEEFVSLNYSYEKAIDDLKEAGLYNHAPCWSRITEGILRGSDISHGKVLSRAMELCFHETGTCNWPDIPEGCWEQAVKELLG